MRVACLALHTDDVNDVNFLILPRQCNAILPRENECFFSLALCLSKDLHTARLRDFSALMQVNGTRFIKSQLFRKGFQDRRAALL